MVTTSSHAGPTPGLEYRFELTPNCSLSPHGARMFVGSLAALTFGLLAWAMQASQRKGAERELILVSDDDVVIERHSVAGSWRTVFPRHWSRVTLRDPQAASHPSRLTIESHGRACEVGWFLTEEERRGVAERLRRLVGKTSESPALMP